MNPPVLPGCCLAWPRGAVGVMAATQNQRQLRRTTRKVMKGAENAVLQLDKMVGDFVEKHME